MMVIGKIYKRNIYGVMGTLIFHILVFGFFVFAEVGIKKEIIEAPILVEFPDIPEIIEKPKIQPENTTNSNAPALTNVASNRLAKATKATTSTEKFFDSEFQKEISKAEKMVSDVNRQLAKEKISLDKIKMPVITTEGMDPDSIKNVVYTGESNIVYYLENRHHVQLANPVYLSKSGGKIIIDITVDRNGNVTKATPRNNQIRDEMILLYAQTAAERTKFNENQSAPILQKGTIQYTFVAQ